MGDVYLSKTVKTRKPHTCDYCGAMIPAGSAAVRESGIGEDGPFASYACGKCSPLLSEFQKWVFQKWVNADFCDGDIFLIKDAFADFMRDRERGDA